MRKKGARFAALLLLAAVLAVTGCAAAWAAPAEGEAQSTAHFLINGEKGYVDVYRTSECMEVTDQLANGNTVSVTLQNNSPEGVKMGLIGYRMENGEICPDDVGDGMTGWVPMDEMVEEYTADVFLRENEEALTDYSAQLDRVVTQGTPVVLYTYPGSGEIAKAFEKADEYLLPQSVYTDEDGEEWAYVNYYYGATGWILVSDPSNDHLEAKPVPYEDLIPAKSPQQAARTRSVWVWVAVGCAAAALIAVGVVLLKKRGRVKAAAQEIIELDERPIPQYVPVDVEEFDAEEAAQEEAEPETEPEPEFVPEPTPATAQAGKQLLEALNAAAEQEKKELTVDEQKAVAAVSEEIKEQAEEVKEVITEEAEAVQTDAEADPAPEEAAKESSAEGEA